MPDIARCSKSVRKQVLMLAVALWRPADMHRSLGAQRCDWREYAWPDIFRNSNAAFVRRSCGRDVCFHLLGFRHRHSGGSRVRGYTWKTILCGERG